jgi:hypothetical protein
MVTVTAIAAYTNMESITIVKSFTVQETDWYPEVLGPYLQCFIFFAAYEWMQ